MITDPSQSLSSISPFCVSLWRPLPSISPSQSPFGSCAAERAALGQPNYHRGQIRAPGGCICSTGLMHHTHTPALADAIQKPTCTVTFGDGLACPQVTGVLRNPSLGHSGVSTSPSLNSGCSAPPPVLATAPPSNLCALSCFYWKPRASCGA